MSRGNAREGIFDDERDDARLRDGLAQTVTRYGWELLKFVFMPNHVHLFLRTPQPNLSRGMQYLRRRASPGSGLCSVSKPSDASTSCTVFRGQPIAAGGVSLGELG